MESSIPAPYSKEYSRHIVLLNKQKKIDFLKFWNPPYPLTFTTASSIPNISIFHFFFQYRFFIFLFYKFKYRWSSTKYYRTAFTFHESYFYGMKNKETLWAAQFLNMKIADFGYLGINLSSTRQY